MKSILACLCAAAGLALVQASLSACGFARDFAQQPPLSRELADAQVLLFGDFENAKKDPKTTSPIEGTVDFVVRRSLKDHASVGAKATIKVNGYLEQADGKRLEAQLAFGEIQNGKPKFFKAIPCSDALYDFVGGLSKIDPKDRVAVMRYCYSFLEHEDPTVARYAVLEYFTSSDDAIGKAARSFQPDRLRALLRKEKTEPERTRMYAFLLGNCGNEADVALLKELFARQTYRQLDGSYSAYVLLKPKEGWEFLVSELKSAEKFERRWMAYRALRFLHTSRPELIAEQERMKAFRAVLDIEDVADFAIEDLRKWKNWSLRGKVLDLYATASVNIVKRAVVRFALQCPGPNAAAFIAKRRQEDPQLVTDLEDYLRYEAEAAGKK